MTRVHIPAPDIEADVSAEQVAAYLRTRSDLWIESRTGPPRFYELGAPLRHRDRYRIDTETFNAGPADRAIADIARAEGRHPSAVLADIVGPAVGSGIPSRGETAECGPGSGAPVYATDIERAKCMFRARLTLQRIERERREASRVYVETADDESAREAQKESE